MLALAASIAMNYPKYKDKVNRLTSLISSLGCRIEGSCGPRFQLMASQVGFSGYSRQRGRDWWYFLPTGENLDWASQEEILAAGVGGASVITWYANSGLHDKISQTIGKCCGASKYPPREFFPNAGEFGGLVKATIDGVKIVWDAQKWHEPSVREAVRLAKLAENAAPGAGNETSTTPVNDTTPIMASVGSSNTMPILLGAAVFAGLLLMNKK